MSERAVRALRSLTRARIFWGHQSVGRNILDGVEEFSRRAGIALCVTKDATAVGPALEHAEIGENKQPLTKLEAFAERLLRSAAPRPDIAAMKLCYVDFAPDTDAQHLLNAYAGMVANIRAARPEITLLHVTVPLKRHPSDPKNRLRRLLRKPVWEDEANRQRNAYNQALRRRFAGEPLFDLARVQSTTPVGVAIRHRLADSYGETLYRGYTDDGGHLNQAGRRTAASAFLIALGGAASPRA